MADILVIVESPSKAKTINKFLGSKYKIEASMGHIRDLPKSTIGIDVENDFEPKYITIRGKGDLLSKLKKEAKKATKVYLATDPDREGEAIAWHLKTALNLSDQKAQRITFNEITKEAVQNAIKNSRQIDNFLVDAQQARRILDRVVGYGISPLLWKKIKKGLSAGRVQSVALKLICDREEEVRDFIPKEYFTIDANLQDQQSKAIFNANFYGIGDEKTEINNQLLASQIESACLEKGFKVSSIKESERNKKQPVPFTTSLMQQEAAKHLNFTTVKTMRIAQQLYEGVEVTGKGTIGLITYLRTDSTRISKEAEEAGKLFVASKYGQHYVALESNKLAENKKNKIQDAHEAIRPSYIELEPIKIKESLSKDQYKLYQLIYMRFMASLMAPAIYQNKTVKLFSGEFQFRASLSKLKFDGYLKTYAADADELKIDNIEKINEDTRIDTVSVETKQHFTQPPSRFTEASLVKALEENGVGRPSTYAPTITTIQARYYVIKEKKNIFPTELGEIVNHLMSENFENIVNIGFTAEMERRLDLIETGEIEWKSILRDFYPTFIQNVKEVELTLEKIEVKDQVSDVVCDLCGKMLVIKMGKFGRFLACPGFPDCRNTKALFETLEGVVCPKCQGAIHIKKSKKGRKYFGCEHNPTCDFMLWDEPIDKTCPECSEILVKSGKNVKCSNNKCQFVENN